MIFYIECVYYKSTFGLSFVGRFVLFQSVLYGRFHCNTGGRKKGVAKEEVGEEDLGTRLVARLVPLLLLLADNSSMLFTSQIIMFITALSFQICKSLMMTAV